MAGTESIKDIAVILAALVLVADQQRDRRAGGFAFEHAGQDFDRIRFLALGHMARGAWLAAIELWLDVGFGQFHARRAAVNHATDGRAMGFAEGGNGKQRAEGIAGHNEALLLMI